MSGLPGDAGTGPADVVRAVEALRPDETALALVAGMAGLGVRGVVTAAPPPGPVRAPDLRPDPVPSAPPVRPAAQDRPRTSVVTVTPVARGGDVPGAVGPDPLPAVLAHQLVPELPHLPLLRRTGAREVLDAAAAVSLFRGDVDVDRLVADLAAGRPPVRLPRRAVRSFDAGLEVLVDTGKGMQPFRRDVDDVLDALRRLVGDGLGVTRYRRTPWTEGRLPRDAERPVLVLGTLGCGRVPDLDAVHGWARVLPTLRRRIPRVTALVPVPRRHWPAALAATRALVPWDVSTGARDAPRP